MICLKKGVVFVILSHTHTHVLHAACFIPNRTAAGREGRAYTVVLLNHHSKPDILEPNANNRRISTYYPSTQNLRDS